MLHAIVRGLALTKISPNFLTFFGLLINIGAAVLFGYASANNHVRMFLYAGLVIIGAGIFDMVDGRVARATNQVTTFGAFFDSVMDRYSDVALFFGLIVYYARAGRFVYLLLVAFVMVSSVMVSYTRARAESLIDECKVGFMERPERIVLVIIGALFERWGSMAPVLWILAVFATITVIHRIAYTYQKTSAIDLSRIFSERVQVSAAHEGEQGGVMVERASSHGLPGSSQSGSLQDKSQEKDKKDEEYVGRRSPVTG